MTAARNIDTVRDALLELSPECRGEYHPAQADICAVCAALAALEAVEARLAEQEQDIAWLLPAAAQRARYGISSCKLLRHCLAGEALEQNKERPRDHHDLLGVTKTVEAAPAHHRERAEAVLAQYIAWLEDENDTGAMYVRKYRASLVAAKEGTA